MNYRLHMDSLIQNNTSSMKYVLEWADSRAHKLSIIEEINTADYLC